MTNMSKLLFLMITLLGTLMAVTSYSWVGMWMGLEINLLSIIPLINNSNNTLSSESSMKYFITQAMASVMLLFSLITMNSYTLQSYPSFSTSIMMTSLLLKTGAAPFHFWFPEIMEGLTWMTATMMLTWQKIAPMLIMMNNLKPLKLLTFSILASLIIGGTMGINQTSLRKILAYSSINHIGWLIAALMINKSIWINYFIIYSIISLNLILLIKIFNINQMNQLFSSSNPLLKMSFIINFLSMGGVPPFWGFLPKWITINALALENLPLAISMVILTLITLFLYVRTIVPLLTFNVSETKNLIKEPKSFILWWSNWINILSLMSCTLWFNLT